MLVTIDNPRLVNTKVEVFRGKTCIGVAYLDSCNSSSETACIDAEGESLHIKLSEVKTPVDNSTLQE